IFDDGNLLRWCIISGCYHPYVAVAVAVERTRIKRRSAAFIQAIVYIPAAGVPLRSKVYRCTPAGPGVVQAGRLENVKASVPAPAVAGEIQRPAIVAE